MGLLLGKVDGNTMIVMDSFALPVEGTETRVNAQAQAYEYMAAYSDAAKQVGLQQTEALFKMFKAYNGHTTCTDKKLGCSLKTLVQCVSHCVGIRYYLIYQIIDYATQIK